MRAFAILAAVCVAACGGDDGAVDGGETGLVTEATTSFTTTSTSGSSGGTGTDTTGTESSSGAATADTTAATTESTTGAIPGCTAIDFLYVIDNSTTMLPHQEALLAAFPMFANTIEASVPAAQDYHVMVVKTDEGWGADCIDECDMLGGCMSDPNFACDMQLRGCDAELGAGVLFPYGDQGTNLPCDIVGDQRYVVADEPDVIPAFTCLAHLGTRTYETPRTAAAMLAALGPTLVGPGGCNEGFGRDDALLVVTVFSDKDDDDSPGDAATWVAEVLAAKGGDGDAVVALGILDDDGSCAVDPETSDTLATFVSSFPHSASTSICTDDYEAFLAEAVDLIGSTCDAWIPPG